MYYANGGTVTVGGKDIRDIPPATLRKNIGLLLQEGYVYSRTIAQNIGMAAETPSLDEIKAAAKTACVDGNIEEFANGYDTVVGERGVTLSGGQRQRVAIARTLIRNTPYIIFDDSLSAVDSDTDSQIRKNLRERESADGNGVTTVIISHRITTVMHADNIIVLDGGKVIESGPHEKLVASNGMYKRIYDLQMSLPDDIKEEARI